MTQDEHAIGHTLRTLMMAFQRREADLLQSVYTEDADWTNAFGRSLHGREAIVTYLRELFADANFGDGEMRGEPQVDVRAITDDVVVARTYAEITGQRTVDGGTIAVRRNHSLKVLQRQAEGDWRIVSEMYMDARDDVTHVHPGDSG